jgi:hypothetical protein
MIYIVTALHPEARALIDHFDLKRDQRCLKIPLFSNENMALVVSGFGCLRSAIATSSLLAHYDEHHHSILFNVGIAGTQDKSIPIGSAFVINKVIDHDREKCFYPDVLYKHDLEEKSLESFNYPVHEHENRNLTTDLVDMEAAGCFEAGMTFLPVHRVQAIKVVSDHLKIFQCTKDSIEKHIRNSIEAIEKTIMSCYQLYQKQVFQFTPTEEEGLAGVKDKLNLTETQSIQLRSVAKNYKFRTGRSINVPNSLQQITPQSKQERSHGFIRIKQYFQST